MFNKYLTANVMTEAYVANGTRLPDSLAGGQLSHGPIMLVRDSKDIPDFTKDVATHLQCWNRGGNIGVAALGGKGVVSDETLKAVIALINTASACGTVKPTAKTTPLSVTETDVSVTAADVETGSGDIDATLTIDGYAAGKAAGIIYSATVTSPVTSTTGGKETVALGTPAIDTNGKVKATVTKAASGAAKAGDSFVITITASRSGEVVNSISKTITLK